MKQLDFSKFTNSNNWRVAHNPDTQLFYLKNDNGNRTPGTYTTRLFAEQALYSYLEIITNHAQKTAKDLSEKRKDGRSNPRKKTLHPRNGNAQAV